MQELSDSARIQNVQSVTSYNWLDGKGREATILVPGKPPRWTPHTTPPLLREDKGQYFRDKNAARYPKHQMGPAVVAPLDSDPTLPTKTDIVACGNTLGNLLRFVRGQDMTFRILVEKVDNTVFFIRRENSPAELILGVRGYGHSFPQAYTTWDADVMNSLSHQRIISYKFARLDLVRFEADGYIKNPLSRDRTSQNSASWNKEKPSVDDLVNSLSQSNVATNASSSKLPLNVRKGTSLVDHADIFDRKTPKHPNQRNKGPSRRGATSPLGVPDPQVHPGIPRQGHIQERRHRGSGCPKRCESLGENSSDLARLAALLHHIYDIVYRAPNGKMEVSHQDVGKLDMREQFPGAGDVLSKEVRARWKSNSKGGVSVESTNEEDRYEKLYESKPEDDDDSSDQEGDIVWDEKASDDFTACSELCGYCGKCSY